MWAKTESELAITQLRTVTNDKWG